MNAVDFLREPGQILAVKGQRWHAMFRIDLEMYVLAGQTDSSLFHGEKARFDFDQRPKTDGKDGP